jgi:hypothetical protein
MPEPNSNVVGDRAQILLGRIGLDGQRLVQLDARVDAEFGENVTQVVFDGPRADEQSRGDLSVRQGFAGQFGDLGLLGGEPAGGLD